MEPGRSERSPSHAIHRQARLAGFLVSMVTDRSQAAAIVGDLLEAIPDRGRGWFWLSAVRISGALAWHNLMNLFRRRAVMESMQRPRLFQPHWKHTGLIVLCVGVALLATNVALHFYPVQWRAQSVIMVAPPRVRVPEDVQNVRPDFEKDLVTVSQRIMSASRLERLIKEFDLYSEARQTGRMESIVGQMRADIAIEVRADNTFSVGFDGDDPRIVKDVVERLVSMLIEENVRARSGTVERAAFFVQNQIEEVRRRIGEWEEEFGPRANARPGTADTIEFQVLQDRLRELLVKREATRTAAAIEQLQIGEQFRLLEPARIPEQPVSPNRLRFNTGGAVVGLGLGMVMVGVSSKRRHWRAEQGNAATSSEPPSDVPQ